MKAVGIHDFSILCSLGCELPQIWHNVETGNCAGMVADNSYLNGETTYLGKIKCPLPTSEDIQNDFDFRANHLLMAAMHNIKEKYFQLSKKIPPQRIGVILGTSTSGVDSLENAIPFFDKHNNWPNYYHISHQRMGCVSEFLAQYLNILGPTMSISTACSSSAKAMISAQRWINNGICDVVITGGVDVLCQLTIKGFNSLGAISNKLCLPFSGNRSGINIGEAVSLFVLKKETDKINLLSGGESSDAYHVSAPDPTGKGAVDCMFRALEKAKLKPEDIEYLNLHGTATLQNDAMESLAVNEVFKKGIYCSSTKALTGHTLGAAGALELGLSAISMSEYNTLGDFIPHVYDNDYDTSLKTLKLVGLKNRLGRPKTIMSNSFAFGGSNASVILTSENRYV